MATVTLVITDHGGDDVVVRVESEPPFELDRDGRPNLGRLTAAQATALFMTLAVDDANADTDFRTLVRDRGWRGA